MRWGMTRVLPLPGPAMMSRGPAPVPRVGSRADPAYGAVSLGPAKLKRPFLERRTHHLDIQRPSDGSVGRVMFTVEVDQSGLE